MSDVEKKKIEKINRLAKIKPKRDGRVPLSRREPISFQPDEGYYYRLVNDQGNRLEKFVNAGYEFVKDKARSRTDASDSSQMGTYASQDVGNGTTAYFMRIPLELWEEDQAEKQRYDDEIMSQIQRGRINGGQPISRQTGSTEITSNNKAK